jgi:hypothetical protein
MFALSLQIFFGKEHLVKNRLISALALEGPFLIRNNFQGSIKPLFTSQSRVEIS